MLSHAPAPTRAPSRTRRSTSPSSGRRTTASAPAIHHCLGHFVARTDMAVALPLLARRMPDAECDGPGVWLPVSGNTGAVSFPIRFTPA